VRSGSVMPVIGMTNAPAPRLRKPPELSMRAWALLRARRCLLTWCLSATGGRSGVSTIRAKVCSWEALCAARRKRERTLMSHRHRPLPAVELTPAVSVSVGGASRTRPEAGISLTTPGAFVEMLHSFDSSSSGALGRLRVPPGYTSSGERGLTRAPPEGERKRPRFEKRLDDGDDFGRGDKFCRAGGERFCGDSCGGDGDGGDGDGGDAGGDGEVGGGENGVTCSPPTSLACGDRLKREHFQ